MSVADTLSHSLEEAAGQPDITEMTVDLADTSFLDSHGIEAMVTGYCAGAGAGFTVVNASPFTPVKPARQLPA